MEREIEELNFSNFKKYVAQFGLKLMYNRFERKYIIVDGLGRMVMTKDEFETDRDFCACVDLTWKQHICLGIVEEALVFGLNGIHSDKK